MLISRLALVAALTAVGSAANAAEHWVYFGTYTGKRETDSKGIYRAKFDDANGTLTAPELAAEMDSPSFVTVHPNKQFLYAVGEGGGKEGGPVVAFAIDAKTGELKKLNEDKSGGPGPCYIVISPKGEFAAVANYGGGSTCVFAVEADGKLGKRLGFVQHTGSSTNPNRQKEPHAHCCAFNAAGDHLYTVDLGIDKIKVFHVSLKKGVEEDTDEDITTPPGSGPRHIAFAPDGKGIYVCGELDSTVNVIKGGKVVQSLSTLPKPTPGNSTAECIISPDGKFVYVSNRGHNTVAAFKVKEDRTLEPAGHIAGDIKTPRNFNIDPSGKWMLIASQDGGKVGVWARDAATGGAKETGTTVPVSRCVCVKFVPVKQ
ncbi:lactonase family protein [Gemmata sp. JC673]|uniref:Lactonase family protein n=1 Tax=Gemmata algarum TaxID=2975278 RepID=A0ABU5ER54_9BACT|nr:lactonase family protein [Gemmata algarum]MDY3557812.1 lactonase family protein [Gemmata algarum]